MGGGGGGDMGIGAWCGGPDLVRGLKWYGNGGPGVVRNVPNPAQNFPPIHTSDMSISSQTNRSSDRLYMYKSINAMGESCYGFDLSMLMLILQHSVWSWSLWCFYMLFNCYFKECFNAKGRTKNRDIDFLRLFSLGFQRSCIKTEVLCCKQSIMW